jgi:FlaA1/EpsC-like NDP-sugar epimerase
MKKILIIGAGHAGKAVASGVLREKEKYKIVGFLDNDTFKIGKNFLGIKVLDRSDNLESIVKTMNIDICVIASTSISKIDLEKVIRILNAHQIEIKIIPNFSQLMLSTDFFSQTKDFEIEDLLGREVVHTNLKKIKDFIQDKRVLVTGAAGSIGSELAKQIIKYDPYEITLLDINENDLYFLERFLRENYPHIALNIEIASIRDDEKIKYLFNNYRPQLVFHAAAHKHVPLMERNPEEAVKNNIFGSQNLMQNSIQSKIEKFVLISTDKAVNPTSVMGATKRVTEMLVEHYNKLNVTKFMAVRFGNVLGSNGSVIPIFKKQIAERKNLTVTHPDIIRYFMTISEACHLVLEAGSLGHGGEIFVLDMGEPIKIIDLAKQMVALSGLELGKDIDIEITGLRPGEKLYEELLYDINNCEKTETQKIYIGKLDSEEKDLILHIKELQQAAKICDKNKIKSILKSIVSTYCMSSESVFAGGDHIE